MSLALTLLGLAGLAASWMARRRWADTTLVASAAWSMLAWSALALMPSLTKLAGHEAADSSAAGSLGAHDPWVTHAWYCAAVLQLAPHVAALGAKRPQHFAWQWIVVSLLGVLWLPAVQGWVFAPEASLEIHPGVRLFLAALVALGWGNWLGTPAIWPATLAALGEILLFWPHLPVPIAFGGARLPAAYALLSINVWWRAAARFSVAADPLDRVWIDFRDTFGAVWAFRLAERFNAFAAQSQWSIRLAWHGFESLADTDSDNAKTLRNQAERQFIALLRRFVGSKWLSQRVGRD